MKGEYEIAIQKDKNAYYARVSLNAEYDEFHKGIKVEFEHDFGGDWQTAIKFGIEYAYEKAPHESGLNVKILDLQWSIIDSSPIIVTFVTIHALWDALKLFPKEQPSFDEETGIFLFPK